MSQTYADNRSYVDLLGSPRVFMHDINTLPMFSNIVSTVDAIEKYERVLPISRSGDIVLTKVSPEKSYLQWLQSVGLGKGMVIVVKGSTNETLPERAVKNGLRKKIDSYLGCEKTNANFCPYYGGQLENAACRHLDLQMYANTNLVKKYDSKINFNLLCKEISVPVIDNIIIKSDFDLSTDNLRLNLNKLKELLSLTGKVIIKGEFGASGSTTSIVTSITSEMLEKLFLEANNKGLQYIIEPLLPVSSSPSSLWFISRERTTNHIRTSNQLLSDGGSVHAGNEFPVTFNENKVKTLSLKIAKRLTQEGFIGPFGIDFVEYNNQFFAVECNPRVTGANYPWELVYLLESTNGTRNPIKYARAENIHLPKKGLNFNDLMELWKKYLYTGDSTNGILIPYNVGPLSSGKVTVLGTGSTMEELNELFTYIKYLR